MFGGPKGIKKLVSVFVICGFFVSYSIEIAERKLVVRSPLVTLTLKVLRFVHTLFIFSEQSDSSPKYKQQTGVFIGGTLLSLCERNKLVYVLLQVQFSVKVE